MLSVTFLGHQGWLFESGESRLLVDPLLTDAFGHGGELGRIHPPRRLELARLPAVSAVYISHEHEDHFNIPSLNRLDRRIPIYLSERTSRAAQVATRELGFQVELARAGQSVELGALTVRWFAPDNAGGLNDDEWDVLPFLVTDRERHGSFFSLIDVELQASFLKELAALGVRPRLWTFANNSGNFDVTRLGRKVERSLPPDTFGLAAKWAEQIAQVRFALGMPEAFLVTGGGWSFSRPEDAWLNHNHFVADNNRLVASLAPLCAPSAFTAPLPGVRLHLEHGKLVRQDDSPFLSPAPQSEWPARDFRGDVEVLEDYEPVCGRRTVSEEEWLELRAALDVHATHFFSGQTFRRLMSGPTSRDGMRHAPVLALRDDEQGLRLLMLDVPGSRFIPVEAEDPISEYVAGIECWASDLAAFFRGEVGGLRMIYGRMRYWNNGGVPFYEEFYTRMHPLARPDVYLAQYRRLIAAEPKDVPRVPATRG